MLPILQGGERVPIPDLEFCLLNCEISVLLLAILGNFAQVYRYIHEK
jgi:hypothetical protein